MFRVFYNIRDERNRSYITYLDYDMEMQRIVNRAAEPIVSPGFPGLFDDSGCSMGCALSITEEETYIYYVGWNLGVTIPWMNHIGLAIFNMKKNDCRKYSEIPIMDRNEVDFLSMSYPYVIKEKERFRMWYGSNTKWGADKADMNHVIKYAESVDGIHWKRDNIICIQGDGRDEYAFSKPAILHEDKVYKMWYSYRGIKYRIGYAESMDGTIWIRKDGEAGIDVSDAGWDSEMIGYPAVFQQGSNTYMLYCGNGYGKTGFGLALREG